MYFLRICECNNLEKIVKYKIMMKNVFCRKMMIIC